MQDARQQDSGIDFVLPWVDGGDPAWRRRKSEWAARESGAGLDAGDGRYRDWGLLKYWFRGVHAFAPWVRRVFFVTDGQRPDWLDPSAPKLVSVDHRDFIPGEWLPTFCSNAIELNLHRIRGLSDRFVYFNDDIFLLRPVGPDRFFRKGLPVTTAKIEPLAARPGRWNYDCARMLELMVVNRNFSSRKSVLRHPLRWLSPRGRGLGAAVWNFLFAWWGAFPGFRDPHLPFAVEKAAMEDLWRAEPELLGETCRTKFQGPRSLGFRLVREWQLASGRFSHRERDDIGRFFRLCRAALPDILACVRNRAADLVCINESERFGEEEAEVFGRDLAAAFETILPQPSPFEKKTRP